MHHGPQAITAAEIANLIAGGETDPCVLEIGANDGTDSKCLIEIPRVELHCFEPEPRALLRFYANMMPGCKPDELVAAELAAYDKWPHDPPPVTTLKKPGDRRWSIHPYAIGRTTGRVTFHQSGGTTPGAHLEDWDLSGSIMEPVGHKDRHKWCNFDRKIEVPISSLDDWYRRWPYKTIDFMYVDVQGAEGEVIAGGVETLKKTRFFYAEFNDWKKELYKGDLTLEQTLAALGPSWELIGVYDKCNALCRNKELMRA